MFKRLPCLRRPAVYQCRKIETDSKPSTFAEKILESQALDPSREQDEKGVDFRKLQIYPLKKGRYEIKPSFFDKTKLEVMPPRQLRMKIDQDWPSVWPTAHSFKASAVPLPIRMGFLKTKQRKHKTPPKAYANLELMKIPNFLHLTPLAIKRHCNAIKKFCNKWPTGIGSDVALERNFPIELTYSDFVFAGPTVRDPRSRVVTLRIKLSALTLDERAKIKFIKLVGEFYDKSTDTLTLTADRCPARHQNRDYVFYLLTALFHQSRVKEAWEEKIEEIDRLNYNWDGTQSEKNIKDYLKLVQDTKDVSPEAKTDKSDSLAAREVGNFKKIVEKYRNDGETDLIVKDYSNSVRKILGLPPPL